MWFKLMPDVLLTRRHFGKLVDQKLVRSFRRNGKRWCKWHGEYVLLKEDGNCVCDTVFPMEWEFI
jgi:hypothetical protein